MYIASKDLLRKLLKFFVFVYSGHIKKQHCVVKYLLPIQNTFLYENNSNYNYHKVG